MLKYATVRSHWHFTALSRAWFMTGVDGASSKQKTWVVTELGNPNWQPQVGSFATIIETTLRRCRRRNAFC
jgi:hypothetical protein